MHRSAPLAVVALTTALLLCLGVTPAFATPPATPTGLPTGIEALQPYVGQAVCDPVAKPGVRAWMNLLLDTYRDTSSLGIVRDCGVGGQSEHKEGRAFDWGVSVTNATQVAHVNEVMTWLLATDKAGNTYAMLRRLGIMYMIWNKHIWKAYQPGSGWQPYSGSDPHTNHVHFSFGWNGAKGVTSFFDKTVAAIDYGPKGPVYPVITPVAVPSNLPVLATYGDLTVAKGATGEVVKVIQRVLQLTVDGQFGSGTEGAIKAFQSQQHLTVTGKVAPVDWLRLFPKPTSPFGALETVDPDFGLYKITGWAIDADKDEPLEIQISLDGLPPVKVQTDQPRPDISKTYVRYVATHGFQTSLLLTNGTHTVCVKAVNLANTPGTTTSLECRKVTADHSPVGMIDPYVQRPGGVTATGWAIDPDTEEPITVQLALDGTPLPDVVANETRTDLADRFPAYGDDHGFRAVMEASEGAHTLCATGLNAVDTEGAVSTALGCRPLAVRHTPVGSLSITGVPGAVQVRGVAIDPDVATASPVQVVVDGVAKPLADADVVVAPIAGWTAFGTSHGFASDLVLANGTHTVCVNALNVPGTPGVHKALGCKTLLVAHDAAGAFELLQVVPGGVLAKGWALDPDSAESSLVRLDVDGVTGTAFPAAVARADLTNTYPGYGELHGFAPLLALKDGTHKVCGTALNVVGTPGVSTALGCQQVTVRHSPQGVLNPLRRLPTGVQVAGWALDPDTASPVTVQIAVDGKTVAQGAASRAGSAWTSAFPAFTTGHGFAATLAMPAGTHQICTTAVNATGTPGTTARFGCRSIVVSNTPVGAVTRLVRGSTGVSFGGWAFDPDTTYSVYVHLRVDGRVTSFLRSNLSSSAFGAAWPGYGLAHGYSAVVKVTRGTHTYCVQPSNYPGTPGTTGSWTCRTATL